MHHPWSRAEPSPTESVALSPTDPPAAQPTGPPTPLPTEPPAPSPTEPPPPSQATEAVSQDSVVEVPLTITSSQEVTADAPRPAEPPMPRDVSPDQLTLHELSSVRFIPRSAPQKRELASPPQTLLRNIFERQSPAKAKRTAVPKRTGSSTPMPSPPDDVSVIQSSPGTPLCKIKITIATSDGTDAKVDTATVQWTAVQVAGREQPRRHQASREPTEDRGIQTRRWPTSCRHTSRSRLSGLSLGCRSWRYREN